MSVTPAVRFGYPQIPYNALTSSADAEDASYPHENIITGSRANWYQRGSTGTSANITFDLGSGNTDTAEYLYIARADLLTALGSDIDIELRASTDNFSASDVAIDTSATNITDSDLTGPNTEDLLVTFTESSAYRYWRVKLASSSSYDYIFSKAFFGTWFDFGSRDPLYPFSVRESASGKAFLADSGAVYRSRGGKSQMRIELTWRVTDAVAESFRATIGKFWDVHTFVLYAEDANTRTHLGGAEVLHVRMLRSPTYEGRGPIADQNYITCEFVEEIS